jgi:hypothetical protein
MRFEFLMAIKMWILVFWVVIACRILGGYQCFEGMHCIHVQDRSIEVCPEDGGNALL